MGRAGSGCRKRRWCRRGSCPPTPPSSHDQVLPCPTRQVSAHASPLTPECMRMLLSFMWMLSPASNPTAVACASGTSCCVLGESRAFSCVFLWGGPRAACLMAVAMSLPELHRTCRPLGSVEGFDLSMCNAALGVAGVGSAWRAMLSIVTRSRSPLLCREQG